MVLARAIFEDCVEAGASEDVRGSAVKICYSRFFDFTWECVWEYSQTITDWRSVCVVVRLGLDDCVKAGIGERGVWRV